MSQPKATDEQLVVSVEEAGRRLSLSRTAVYGLMNSGQLPFARLGRTRRIPVEALTELVRRNMVPARVGQ